MKRDLGDFQTPTALVDAVLKQLAASGRRWSRALEPTCGRGNFIKGLLHGELGVEEVWGFELQAEHLSAASAATSGNAAAVHLRQADFFSLDLRRDLVWRTAGPLLVVGNPPWVTNAELGALGSANLPDKRNLKGLNGLAARTGSANFDLAESIWLKLLCELVNEDVTIALLCKTSVARAVLQFAHDQGLPVVDAAIYRIDAKEWFAAAVDACLFTVTLGSGTACYEAPVFASLGATVPETVIGFAGRRMVSDVGTYRPVAYMDGCSSLNWRQGIKHDAASVMELEDGGFGLKNKLGEIVEVEGEFVYPLLKSSGLFHWDGDRPRHFVIVPQHRLGEDTTFLATAAPRLWQYLTSHQAAFTARKSSIYQGQPPFAIFGIGEYSFAPYKVAVSGLHKYPCFRTIGPVNGLPVMLDDTCYFVPCRDAMQAALIATLLNRPAAQAFLKAVSFTDSKRPITKSVLSRIDILALLKRIDKAALIEQASTEVTRLLGREHDLHWPDNLADLIISNPPPMLRNGDAVQLALAIA